MIDQLPPRSIEAEESILSTILINNDVIFDVMEGLGKGDFYRSAHGIIFDAMCGLSKKEEPIDLVTLATELAGRGKLGQIGGAAYLSQLIDTVPVAANVQDYARIVHERALLREMSKVLSDGVGKCFGANGDALEALNEIKAKVFAVDSSAHKDVVRLGAAVEEQVEYFEKLSANPGPTGTATGLDLLDRLTGGLQDADLIVIAARPSMGKTAFMVNTALHMGKKGKKILEFSLEMSLQSLTNRHISVMAGINTARMRYGFKKADWARLAKVSAEFQSMDIAIDDTAGIHYREIESKARRMKATVGLDLIMVDYLGLVGGDTGQKRNRHEALSQIAKALKGTAKRLSIPVVALCQLNRSLENRTDKHPILSDLRESGTIEEAADLVGFIYRDEVYYKEMSKKPGIMEFDLKKQRNGPTGSIDLSWEGRTTRITNLPDYEVYKVGE
jgi:replicative DNA helicase